MHTSFLFKWTRLGLALLMVLLAVTPLIATHSVAVAAQPPGTGVVCTTGVSPNPTFNLTAGSGNIVLGDGNTMYMWSYSLTGGAFQYPGPVLCVNQGDTVTVILQNSLPELTSLIFPGQENVQANGALAQPDLVNNSLSNSVIPGGSVTYSFTAANPGTFIYESGTDPKKQVGMGLASALIVRPTTLPTGGKDPDPAHYAYNRADSVFTPEEEFLAFLSEIDPYMHWAVQAGQPFNMNYYHPRYWLINGRGFPDSVADNYASWLPYQPYGALARIHPYDPNPYLPDNITPNPAFHPYPALQRFVSVGTEDYPFHPHGDNGLVIGRDGHPLGDVGLADLSMEKFAVNIGGGQTWDSLFKWYDAEGYNETTNPVPVTIPEMVNQTIGMWYSGSPYLGVMGVMPPGVMTLNQCGEYYIISHNHALYQLVAWDVTMAGPVTYMRIDPPLPNNCP